MPTSKCLCCFFNIAFEPMDDTLKDGVTKEKILEQIQTDFQLFLEQIPDGYRCRMISGSQVLDYPEK